MKCVLSFEFWFLHINIYMYLYISNFFHALVVLHYLPKLKRGVELVYSADFL